MLKTVSIENFKCFGTEVCSIPLRKVTVLYGKNGRGKSTLIQSLLIIAKTMRNNNNVDTLLLMNDLAALGSFEDVLNSMANKKEFSIGLVTEKEEVQMCFVPVADKPQLARLNGLKLNGRERFESYGTDDKEDQNDSKLRGVTISDIEILQNLKDLEYVAADRKGPVNVVQRLDALPDNWIGTKGEYLINVLAKKDLNFLAEVEHALSTILTGAAIKINHKDTERIELFLNSQDGAVTYKPVNVGFGYSYVLPVIIMALIANEGATIIVENPEAHLHPGAQSRLMEYLITKAEERGLQLIVESHSDHVVNGMRIAIKKGELNHTEGIINYFDRDDNGMPQIEHIYVDNKGELSAYPDDFLDEWTKQLLQLI